MRIASWIFVIALTVFLVRATRSTPAIREYRASACWRSATRAGR
jgi:hypothetical protein